MNRKVEYKDVKDELKILDELQDYGKIMYVFETVINGSSESRKFIDAFEYIYKDNYPMLSCLNRVSLCEKLQEVVDDVVPKMNSEDVATSLFGFVKKKVYLNASQKEDILRIKSIIQNAKSYECEHKTLSVIPLLHGGGFTPDFAMPELVCPDCYLNVTLYPTNCVVNGNRFTNESIGIKISKQDNDAFINFVNKCLYSPLKIHIHPSCNMIRTPKKVYESSQKFFEDYTIEIINKELFESKTGL